MTRTRTGAGNNQGGNDGDLPPPSTNEFFAQFLGNSRAMEDILHLIAQNNAHARQQHQGPELNQYSSFKDF